MVVDNRVIIKALDIHPGDLVSFVSRYEPMLVISCELLGDHLKLGVLRQGRFYYVIWNCYRVFSLLSLRKQHA